MKASLPLFALAACEPAPPPPVEEVDWAAATGPAVVRLEEGNLTLDGTAIGALREPGMLRQSRHRKLLQALQLRSGQDPEQRDPPEVPLLSQDRPAVVEISPTTPWADLHPVLATAAWAGFGPLTLRLLPEGAALGPLGVDTQQSPPWAGEPVLGVAPVLEIALGSNTACGELSFEALVADGARRRLPQRLRAVGTEPLVDCVALFSGDGPLTAACAGSVEADLAPDTPPSLPPGQRALPVAASGDVLVPPAAEGAPLAWRTATDVALRGLGVDTSFRVVLAPRAEADAASITEVFGAFTDLGLPLPLLAFGKPAEDEGALICPPAKVQGAHGVRLAGARWIGEHHRP
jgi:hypothetical protein